MTNPERGIRQELRYWVANVLFYSGILTLRQILRRKLGHGRESCVLGLHRILRHEEISKSSSSAGMILRERTFGELLDYLQRKFQVISLADFLNTQTDGARYHKPTCLLTFDDGWRDNYTTALPLLSERRVPAVVFLITGMIGTSEVFWVERLNQAWQPFPRRMEIRTELLSLGVPETCTTDIANLVEHLKHMPAARRNQILSRVCPENHAAQSSEAVDGMASWDEVRIMSQSGVQFGAHTATHPLLVYEEDSVVQRELLESKLAVEAKLGTEVRAFAYPNGNWDRRVRSFVEQAGYQCAFTTERGWHGPLDDPYSISRIMIHEGVVTGRTGRFSPAMFELRLSGWF